MKFYRKPTIHDIKASTPGPFFDRETLKHWGQRVKDFTVARSPQNRIFIYARRFDTSQYPRVFCGYTVREFTGTSLHHPGENFDTLSKILDYIENN